MKYFLFVFVAMTAQAFDSLGVESPDGKAIALASCQKATFDQAACEALVQSTAYYDSGAAWICSEVIFSEIHSCLDAAKNKSFNTYEIATCASERLPKNKSKCFSEKGQVVTTIPVDAQDPAVICLEKGQKSKGEIACEDRESDAANYLDDVVDDIKKMKIKKALEKLAKLVIHLKKHEKIGK